MEPEGISDKFLKVAWSAKVPKVCPHCHQQILESSMHPCNNGDWTCRCLDCLGLLYRVTPERVVYWPECADM